MKNKGFTFAQIAAMLLVLIGLIAFIVLTTSQIGKSGSASSEITEVVSSSSEALDLGNQCAILGGTCNTCDAIYDIKITGEGGANCGTSTSGIYCCREGNTDCKNGDTANYETKCLNSIDCGLVGGNWCTGGAKNNKCISGSTCPS